MRFRAYGRDTGTKQKSRFRAVSRVPYWNGRHRSTGILIRAENFYLRTEHYILFIWITKFEYVLYIRPTATSRPSSIIGPDSSYIYIYLNVHVQAPKTRDPTGRNMCVQNGIGGNGDSRRTGQRHQRASVFRLIYLSIFRSRSPFAVCYPFVLGFQSV